MEELARVKKDIILNKDYLEYNLTRFVYPETTIKKIERLQSLLENRKLCLELEISRLQPLYLEYRP